MKGFKQRGDNIRFAIRKAYSGGNVENKLEEGVYQFKIISSAAKKILIQRSECELWVRQPPFKAWRLALICEACASYAPPFGSGSSYVRQENSTDPRRKLSRGLNEEVIVVINQSHL